MIRTEEDENISNYLITTTPINNHNHTSSSQTSPKSQPMKLFKSQSINSEHLPSPPLSINDEEEEEEEWNEVDSRREEFRKLNKGKCREVFLVLEESHNSSQKENEVNGFNFIKFRDESSKVRLDLTFLEDEEREEVDEVKKQDNYLSLTRLNNKNNIASTSFLPLDDEVLQSSPAPYISFHGKRLRSESPSTARKVARTNTSPNECSNQSSFSTTPIKFRGSSATLPSPLVSPPTYFKPLPIITTLTNANEIPPNFLSNLNNLSLQNNQPLRPGVIQDRAPPLPPPLEKNKIPFYLIHHVILPHPKFIPSQIDDDMDVDEIAVVVGVKTGSMKLDNRLSSSSLSQNTSRRNLSPSPIPSESSSTATEKDESIITSSFHLNSNLDHSPIPKLLESSKEHWKDLMPNLDLLYYLHPDDILSTTTNSTIYHPSANPKNHRVKNLSRFNELIPISTRWKINPPGSGLNSNSSSHIGVETLVDPWLKSNSFKNEEEEDLEMEEHRIGFKALSIHIGKNGIEAFKFGF